MEFNTKNGEPYLVSNSYTDYINELNRIEKESKRIVIDNYYGRQLDPNKEEDSIKIIEMLMGCIEE